MQYEGLPPVHPASGAQVDKKKLFIKAAEKLVTDDDAVGTWDGHRFMTSAGPCKCVDISGGEMH